MAERSLEEKFDLACSVIADLTIANAGLANKMTDTLDDLEGKKRLLVLQTNAAEAAIGMLQELRRELNTSSNVTAVRRHLDLIQQKLEQAMPF